MSSTVVSIQQRSPLWEKAVTGRERLRDPLSIQTNWRKDHQASTKEKQQIFTKAGDKTAFPISVTHLEIASGRETSEMSGAEL